MYVLIIVGFNHGSENMAVLPIQQIKFDTEKACLEAEKKLNEMTRMGRSNKDVFKAFYVKDSHS